MNEYIVDTEMDAPSSGTQKPATPEGSPESGNASAAGPRSKEGVVAPKFGSGEFPLDALPADARDMASEIVRVCGVPPELPGMAALATLAGCCGKSFKLVGAVNGFENHANLYIIAGAPRGAGKSCVNWIIDPLLALSAEWEQDHRSYRVPRLKSERDALARRIKLLSRKAGGSGNSWESEAAQKEFENLQHDLALIDAELASPAPVLWAANCTSEALGEILARSGESVMIYSPDGGEVLRALTGTTRGGSKGDFELLLSGYTGEPVRINRLSREPLLLRQPCLTLLPLVQPVVVRDFFANPDAAERGLLARTLCFVCHTKLREDDGIVAEIDGGVLERWRGRVRTIAGIRRVEEPGNQRVVHCTAEAREVFRLYHNEMVKLRAGELALIEEEMTRCRENACRIALALCAGDDIDATELTGAQAERAVRLARWAQYITLALFTGARHDQRVKQAEQLRKILRANGGAITLRMLERNHYFTKTEATNLSRWFPDSFMVERRETAGRPSHILRLVNFRA